MFVFLVLMLMFMCLCLCASENRHKTNKWVRSSAYAYAYVAGVFTCLCLCYDHACAYAYALVRTSLKKPIYFNIEADLAKTTELHSTSFIPIFILTLCVGATPSPHEYRAILHVLRRSVTRT